MFNAQVPSDCVAQRGVTQIMNFVSLNRQLGDRGTLNGTEYMCVPGTNGWVMVDSGGGPVEEEQQEEMPEHLPRKEDP